MMIIYISTNGAVYTLKNKNNKKTSGYIRKK